jgi:hypothetical protein
LGEDGIARLKRHPEQVAEALLLEYQSLCLNPRGAFYRNRTLLSIIVANQHTETLRYFGAKLEEAEYTPAIIVSTLESVTSSQKYQ